MIVSVQYALYVYIPIIAFRGNYVDMIVAVSTELSSRISAHVHLEM
jgi:hypothetical protein